MNQGVICEKHNPAFVWFLENHVLLLDNFGADIESTADLLYDREAKS